MPYYHVTGTWRSQWSGHGTAGFVSSNARLRSPRFPPPLLFEPYRSPFSPLLLLLLLLLRIRGRGTMQQQRLKQQQALMQQALLLQQQQSLYPHPGLLAAPQVALESPFGSISEIGINICIFSFEHFVLAPVRGACGGWLF
ncbi:hypothetical protein BHM03_00015394 [Ensete ventricosum]|nr:hypothetical protein BHM03_00015394 [Ensete ventricosum]